MQDQIPIPRNKLHGDIGKYIMDNPNGNFSDVIKNDGRWEIFCRLSDRCAALFCWYPFKKGCKVLQINADFGNITDLLCRKCGEVVAVEQDEYKACCLEKRCAKHGNLEVVNGTYRNADGYYDYIIYTDDQSTAFSCYEDYCECIGALRSMLKPDGRLLFVAANRFGIKYLCGGTDGCDGSPFDGVTDNLRGAYRFGRKELLNMLGSAGFESVKLYYPLPDHITAQMIYTDEYMPDQELSERLRPYIINKGGRVLDEADMFRRAAENDGMALLANSFIAECGRETCNVVYAAISSERSRDRAFSTVVCSDGTVRKIPLYSEGVEGLERLVRNTEELVGNGVPTLETKLSDGCAIMDRICSPTLADHFRAVAKTTKSELLECIDKLYGYILMSSEKAGAEDNALRHYAPGADWGPILKKAYLEMIPVNCFYTPTGLLFFDQEFTAENYPAKHVLFRAIRDIYAFVPETEELLPLADIKKHYGMEKLWDYFQREESRFQTELRQWNIYRSHFEWLRSDEYAINRNRRNLAMMTEKEPVSEAEDMFNPVAGIADKKVVIFGAGKMLEYYLNKYGAEYHPEFVVDNDRNKWGTIKNGLEIRDPMVLAELPASEYRIIVASNYYREIADQLQKMNISMADFRIYQRDVDELRAGALTDPISDGKYNIGYVTGAFDMFHIGHLNLLRKSKERCHYLIVGVLTNEIMREDKDKDPVIPFEERIEIVKQCRYVDRVVAIDKSNAYKINAWKELRFGCLFSGNDHEGDSRWFWLHKQLRSLGSNLEFFPYTESTSSTMLRAALKNEINKDRR